MAPVQTDMNSGFKKRRMDHLKNGRTKRAKIVTGFSQKARVDGKMKKLFRKRAKNYNSDDDDDDEKRVQGRKDINFIARKKSDILAVMQCNEKDVDEYMDKDNGDTSEDEGDTPPEVTRFTEGCRAFRAAFEKIMKKKVAEGSLGPVLSGNKELVANKLSEEVAEQKFRSNSKKEKLLAHENGHVKPANFLDSHEKFLLSVATKGVVKFFNAVNKAQNSKSTSSKRGNIKDTKNIQKDTFFTELEKPSQQLSDNAVKKSRDLKNENEPAWAPLQRNYMQSSSKFENWNTMEGSTKADERLMTKDSWSGGDDDDDDDENGD